jgi:hypothetical protein
VLKRVAKMWSVAIGDTVMRRMGNLATQPAAAAE